MNVSFLRRLYLHWQYSTMKALLSVARKQAEPGVGLREKLHAYLSNAYSEEDARACDDDLHTLERFRARAVERPSGTHEEVRAELCRYYHVLNEVQARFPISKDKQHVRCAFVWFDSFKPRSRASEHSVHFEKAAVLFNIAALHSRRAASLAEQADVKVQRYHCMLAASFFEFLHDHECAKIDGATLDLSLHCVAFLRSLCLAHAQECVLMKAHADGKSNAACARLAAGAASLYGDAVHSLEQGKLTSHVGNMAQHAHLRLAVARARSMHHLALDATDDEFIGLRIARLQAAHDYLAPALRSARPHSSSISVSYNECDELSRRVNEFLSESRKDNDEVFMQFVPTFSSLTQPQVRYGPSCTYTHMLLLLCVSAIVLFPFLICFPEDILNLLTLPSQPKC